MKKVFKIVLIGIGAMWALGLLIGAFNVETPKIETKEATTAPQSKVSIKRVFLVGDMADAGNDVFYSVKNFDSNAKADYDSLIEFAREDWKDFKPSVKLWFIADKDDYRPYVKQGQLFQNDEERKKVILCFMITTNRAELITYDPFGFGIFQEVK